MATLTIEVPDQIAKALDPLGEQPLVADSTALKDVLRWNVHALHETLWGISERVDDLEPDALRRLARRLEVLAGAIEAAGPDRPAVTAAQIKGYITRAREESGISDDEFADLLRISFGVERVEDLARGDADRRVCELREHVGAS